MIRVYTTAKVLHASMLTQCRAEFDGIYFTARWPLMVNVSSEKARPVVFWLNDNFDDIQRSDYVIVYAEEHDVLKTSLIEIGWAMGHGKKIICVGENAQFEPWSTMCLARVRTMTEAIKRIRQDVNPKKEQGKDYYLVGEKILTTSKTLSRYTTEEGGHWHPAPVKSGVSLCAVEFTDGSIFDLLVGWRPSSMPEQRHRV